MTLFVAAGLLLDTKQSGQPHTGVSGQATVTNSLPKRWYSSYDEAVQVSRSSNLPLVLHFDASWCGACRRMESEVLHQPGVTALLGQEVVGARINADQYKNLIAEFKIQTLPTEVVLYSNGSQSRYVGAASLSNYISRLKSISGSNRSYVKKQKPTTEQQGAESKPSSKSVRSCLIVRHDGKMVGVGGFSPVALTEQRQWKRGTAEFRAAHEGVCYFLQNQSELEKFKLDPEKYVPHMHGCDLVELYNQNRATAGAIEYGAFYRGQVYFFASLENRDRFEDNPTWYLGVMTDSRTANDEMFPFLNRSSVNN